MTISSPLYKVILEYTATSFDEHDSPSSSVPRLAPSIWITHMEDVKLCRSTLKWWIDFAEYELVIEVISWSKGEQRLS